MDQKTAPPAKFDGPLRIIPTVTRKSQPYQEISLTAVNYSQFPMILNVNRKILHGEEPNLANFDGGLAFDGIGGGDDDIFHS
jgi:hypothetical protein